MRGTHIFFFLGGKISNSEQFYQLSLIKKHALCVATTITNMADPTTEKPEWSFKRPPVWISVLGLLFLGSIIVILVVALSEEPSAALVPDAWREFFPAVLPATEGPSQTQFEKLLFKATEIGTKKLRVQI